MPSEMPVSIEAGGMYWFLWNIFSLRALFSLLRFAWVVVNNVYCIPAYFVYLLLLSPLRLVWPDLFWRAEEIFFNWLLSMVACWNYTAGYNVFESGDRLALEDNFLFMPNHQSTADVPLCMTIFAARRKFADKVMWIMDKVFKYTNFGWVSWMHDDFFILAGKTNRDKSLEDLRQHLQDVFEHKNRKYLVLFPEGGFLRKRKAVSQAFAKKNDLGVLEHCTLPRTGALEVVLDTLGPKSHQKMQNGDATGRSIYRDYLPTVTKIIDVTIAYPEGKPIGLIDIATGWRPPCVTHVHYRVFDVKDIPSDPVLLRPWMYNLYFEKEKLLATYYETGRFPHDLIDPKAGPPRELVHDPLRFFLLHMFFMISSYLMWTYSEGLRTSLGSTLLSWTS